MPLTGHNILVVESEIGPFVTPLQRSLEAAGAETMVARNLAVALLRIDEFAFTAVVPSKDYAVIKERVEVPVVVYGSRDVEREPQTIVAELARQLAN